MEELILATRPDNRIELRNSGEIVAGVTLITTKLIHKWDHEITDKEELKTLKLDRADLNAKIKEIARKRIDHNEQVMGIFNSQCKTIEKILKDCELALKKRVDEFVNKQPKESIEVALHTLSIQSADLAKLEQVKKYATELGCLVSEVK